MSHRAWWMLAVLAFVLLQSVTAQAVPSTIVLAVDGMT